MPTIYLAGDSTAARKQDCKRPETGWGECLHLFLSERYIIENFAENGRSAKSFIASGALDLIASKIQEGDVLLIQFGHNDQKQEDPLRYSDAEGEYRDLLLKFVEVARSKNALPVLLSSISRRKYLATGKADPYNHLDYPLSCRELALDYGVPFIDMHKRTLRLLDELREKGSKALYLHLEKGEHPNYPEGIADNSHLNRYGAMVVASMIAEELIRLI